MILAHGENGELPGGKSAALDELLEHGLSLGGREHVGGRSVCAKRVVGVGFDDDPLPLIRSLHGSCNLVENAIAVGLKLGGARLKELIARHFDADDLAVLADVEAGDLYERERL